MNNQEIRNARTEKQTKEIWSQYLKQRQQELKNKPKKKTTSKEK